MNNITDFAIIQRKKDGYGYCTFGGEFECREDVLIVARVVYEDNSMVVIPWTECEIDGNKWSVDFKVPQGGLYRFEAKITAGEFDRYNNRYDWTDFLKIVHFVGVGDIFLMAGQSNMSGYGKDFAYDPSELGVHSFNNRGEWCIASHPLNSIPDAVYPNDDGSSYVSPGLSFGKMMKKRLGVPVGIVPASKGGTAFEDWDPFDEEENYLYHNLLDKAEAVGGIAGILWFQGCTDTENVNFARTYYERFKKAVEVINDKFNGVPVVVCQINRHAYKKRDNDREWGMVKETQRQIARDFDNVFAVPTYDLYTCDGIHNASGCCVILGERIANVMLHGGYGQVGCFAPDVKSVKKISGNSVFIEFDGEYSISTMDDSADKINIEDENGLIDCISAVKDKAGIIVTAERNFGEHAVFHAYWKKTPPTFYIRDKYGLPMLGCYNVRIE